MHFYEISLDNRWQHLMNFRIANDKLDKKLGSQFQLPMCLTLSVILFFDTALWRKKKVHSWKAKPRELVIFRHLNLYTICKLRSDCYSFFRLLVGLKSEWEVSEHMEGEDRRMGERHKSHPRGGESRERGTRTYFSAGDIKTANGEQCDLDDNTFGRR